MMCSALLRTMILGMIASSTIAIPARAQDFYAGKTINIYIGTGEGSGAMTSYPRAIAQIVARYVPGHPTVVIRHMPGAGGIKAANYIYGIAPQDGTTWGFITRGFVRAPLLQTPQADFDPTRFQWIGTPSQETTVAAVWTAGTMVRSINDATRQEVVFGGTSLVTDTGLFPTILNKLIDTKFKVVVGYKASTDVDIAMERGEAQGKIWTWASLKSGRTANWITEGKVHPELIAPLGRQGLAHDPATGEDLQAIVARMYGMPVPVVEKARGLIPSYR